MLRFVAGAILSFVVSNWIYSEVLLIAPQVGPFSRRVMQVLQIPTHDKWDDISSSNGSSQLALDIDNLISDSPVGKAFRAVGLTAPRNFQARINRQAKPAGQVVKAVVSPILTGEDIFVSHAVNVVLPGGYSKFKL